MEKELQKKFVEALQEFSPERRKAICVIFQRFPECTGLLGLYDDGVAPVLHILLEHQEVLDSKNSGISLASVLAGQKALRRDRKVRGERHLSSSLQRRLRWEEAQWIPLYYPGAPTSPYRWDGELHVNYRKTGFRR